MADNNVEIGIKTEFNNNGVDSAEKGIDEIVDSVEEVEDAANETEKAIDGVTESAKEAEKAIDGMTESAKETEKAVDNVSKSIEKVGKSAQGASKRVSEWRKELSEKLFKGANFEKPQVAKNFNAAGLSQTAEMASSSVSALGSAISFVNPQMGMMMQGLSALTNGIKGLGIALKALLTNPYALAIAAIAGAFLLCKKYLDSMKESARKAFEAMQTKRLNEIAKANERIAESFRNVSKATEAATDKMRKFMELDSMRKENANGMFDADTRIRRAKRLASAKDDDEKQQLNDKFALQDIRESAARQKAVIRANADSVWNKTMGKNNAKTLNTLNDNFYKAFYAESDARFTLNKTKQRIVKLETSGKDENDPEMQRLLSAEKEQTESLKAQTRKREEIEEQINKIKREEKHAIEKRNLLLNKIDIIEKGLVASESELKNRIKEREEAENKATKERAEAFREQLQKENDDYEADKRMKIYAIEDEVEAGEKAIKKLSAKDGMVGTLKTNDRIASIGGFSTAAAAAVTGGMGIAQKNPEIAKISENVGKLTRQLEELNKKASFTATWN